MSLQLTGAPGGRSRLSLFPSSGNRYKGARRPVKPSSRAKPSRQGKVGKKNSAKTARAHTTSLSFSRAALWSVYGILGLVFFTGMSLALLYGYRWMTNNTFFALQELEVRGIERLAYTEVVEAAGVQKGENSLDLKMRQVESGLSDNPWVDSVAVKRILPNKLAITIKERKPTFWVHKENGLFFADYRGNIIAPVDSAKFEGLPLLKIDEGAAPLLDAFFTRLAQTGPKDLPFAWTDAAWIHVSQGSDLTMYFDAQDVVLNIDLTQWDHNVTLLNRVWADLEKRGENTHVRSINATGGNVWVRWGAKA